LILKFFLAWNHEPSHILVISASGYSCDLAHPFDL
jgi:hypothetical protein